MSNFTTLDFGKPSVVFILTEDMGRGDLTAYGGAQGETQQPRPSGAGRDEIQLILRRVVDLFRLALGVLHRHVPWPTVHHQLWITSQPSARWSE